jgi:anaerobic dimethyl sulfoxide reductase subunit B (iron-sulfur subunit)
MCIGRLEKAQLPVCVLACPTRALDFGPIEGMIKKYGNVQTLPGMPDAKKARPSVIFKPRVERKKIIPYNSARALQLMCEQGNRPPLYESVEAITHIPPGMIKRNHLVMKPKDSRELMDVSRNDEG